MSKPHAIRGDGPFLHPEPFRHYRADPLTTYRARQAAGWTTNADGWVSTCGTTEDGWALKGYPFPEEPGFAEWYSARSNYEAIDNDRPSPTWADAYLMTPGRVVTLAHRELRAGAPAVITRATVQVVSWLPEYGVLSGSETRRFCFVEGYPEKGRSLPTYNPYDRCGQYRERSDRATEDGAQNTYLVGNGNGQWRVVAPYPMAHECSFTPAQAG